MDLSNSCLQCLGEIDPYLSGLALPARRISQHVGSFSINNVNDVIAFKTLQVVHLRVPMKNEDDVRKVVAALQLRGVLLLFTLAMPQDDVNDLLFSFSVLRAIVVWQG